MGTKILSLVSGGLKHTGPEVIHSNSFSTEGRKEWSCTSCWPCVPSSHGKGHRFTFKCKYFCYTPKRILEWKLMGTRFRGRPRKRWIAGIEEDMQMMGIRRWRKQCKERAEWKRITEKTKTHCGL
jgi:hypothetical protein